MILGLTGSMGCGKSTASRFFQDFGFLRIDSDDIIRNEILLDPEVEKAIRSKFGPQVFTPEGRVDRVALAKIVFYDDAALAWQEEMVHPRLFQIWRGRLDAQPDGNWVVEVPLLFEKGLENWFDFTLCVTTSVHNQLARLAERGIPRALAEQRISKQLPLAKKIEFADFVLSNDGSPEFLRDQVAQVISRVAARG